MTTNDGCEHAAESSTDDSSADESTTGRRQLITKGAIATAIGAAAGLALTGSRARAGNGDTMFVGEADTGTATTELSGGTTFQVINGNSSGGASIYGRKTSTTAGGSAVRGQHAGATTGTGVYGQATGTQGTGVRGRSTGVNGKGVLAEATGANGRAVNAEATGSNGYGVYADAPGASGVGVLGMGGDYGVVAKGANDDVVVDESGRLRFSKSATPPPGPSAAGNVGTLARDSSGALWYCVATNRWVQLGGPTSSGALITIDPARVYDSRAGLEPLGVTKGQINPGQNRAVDCTVNTSGVPATARAVIINLTAANSNGPGNLGVYPDGSPPPATSSINYTQGVNIANSTTSGCGPGALIRVQCGGIGGCDFIVDVVGYYL